YALALRGKGYHLAALDRDPDTIAHALKNGMVNEGITAGPVDSSLSAQSATGVRRALGQADGVILGLYPDRILPWLRVHRGLLKQGALVTDMAAVKSAFVAEAQAMMPPGCEFIPSHPMVGIARTGVHHADNSQFHRSNFLVTPTGQNTKAGVEFARRLGELLGFKTITVLSPEEHDLLVGLTSQLPHILAVTMMHLSEDDRMYGISAASYRNLVNIADTNPDLWSEILLANTPILTKQIGTFVDSLQDLRRRLANGDREGLKALLTASRQRSRAFTAQDEGAAAES
ncbi:prephenate dehydrogenase, partial [Ruminococcaceae bacterium OttesenSCG-928-D13]|nr:prephenate dehydrogenase [Ruminococcaceae bacterium OttesenSCG-928-D13]